MVATHAPPQAIEAEQSVLGALMLAPQAIDRIEFLKAEHFYRAEHRKIFETIIGMIDRNRQVDALTVGDAIGQDVERSYLAGLANATPSIGNIGAYARLVKERWMLRQVQAIATEAASEAYAAGADARTIAEAAESAFLAILDESKGGEEIGFDEAVKRAVDAREAPAKAVISTGLDNLDRMLSGGGMKAGQLIVIAGRPSMGKSALAFQIAESVAANQTVAAYTLEMEAQELADRSITYHAHLTDKDQAALYCMDLKMRVDGSPAIGLSTIRLRCRRIKRKRGLALIVVDYLQLMDSKGENREQEISKLSRGLKALAKELSAPVIAVAQLNRGVEQRNDKRPMMSDLRESGAIEQDADVVLMLYRDEYYHTDTLAKGIAEAIIRKQRGGMTGTAYLTFAPDLTRFRDYHGPRPQYGEPRSSQVKNFSDYRNKAAGEE